jgi:hypothetical protein
LTAYSGHLVLPLLNCCRTASLYRGRRSLWAVKASVIPWRHVGIWGFGEVGPVLAEHVTVEKFEDVHAVFRATAAFC